MHSIRSNYSLPSWCYVLCDYSIYYPDFRMSNLKFKIKKSVIPSNSEKSEMNFVYKMKAHVEIILFIKLQSSFEFDIEI
jgi:hypothetical protein